MALPGIRNEDGTDLEIGKAGGQYCVVFAAVSSRSVKPLGQAARSCRVVLRIMRRRETGSLEPSGISSIDAVRTEP
ncbi:MAG: hypothetical protein CSB44_07745 [Gammaproteobacteria bacterium]|nr:MAG: hypothetical protein CSB44_07745 [Gammaproteobacteria bacterium]